MVQDFFDTIEEAGLADIAAEVGLVSGQKSEPSEVSTRADCASRRESTSFSGLFEEAEPRLAVRLPPSCLRFFQVGQSFLRWSPLQTKHLASNHQV